MAIKTYCVSVYDTEFKKVFNISCNRIDITDVQSIFNMGHACESDVVRVQMSIKSINVELGTITVYYNSGFYAEIKANK
jgi:hypothetical protein